VVNFAIPSRSSLSFTVAHRPGENLRGGAFKTARTFLDFVVDGRSLGELIKARKRDIVSFLIADFAESETARGVRRLLLQEPADLPNNRRSLYICPECGDLGCGAVTVEVIDTGDSFRWQRFGYENTWEDKLDFSCFENVGPFAFEKSSYQLELNMALEKLKSLDSRSES